MPEKDKTRINRTLNEMKGDPFSGDVAPLKGQYQGLFRRRVGAWRIIFSVKPDQQLILVGDIKRRTTSTY